MGSFLQLKRLEGEGGFRVIMVRHGYPCQQGSEVKGSLLTAGISQDGAPPLLASCEALEVQRDLFSLSLMPPLKSCKPYGTKTICKKGVSLVFIVALPLQFRSL